MNLNNWIKENIRKLDKNKLLVNVIIVFLIGVFIIISTNYFINDKDETLKYTNVINNNNFNIKDTIEDYSTKLEHKLENILNQIKGVDKVKVMITLEETIEKIPAKNTTNTKERTTEKDAEGGTREVIREDYTEQIISSNNSFAVIKQVNPTIKGVIVVARGVENVRIKEQLYNAVKTVLGIPGNRIEIYSSK